MFSRYTGVGEYHAVAEDIHLEINMFKLWVAILIMLSVVVHLSGDVSRPLYPTILFAMVLGAVAREGIAMLDHIIVSWVSRAGSAVKSY
ncbi:hypothetical protein CXF83_15250 [Shewanella sp. Choline-02u-19]|nr:hypothetical protein CXF84_13095 [Shewanella sp. Bg11-22]PKI27972.1 hypothetical protein CXF83_15250 [Shewanella sp. Choline-02u-19]